MPENNLPLPGNTPLLNLDGVLAKLECTNPCGSVKDRIARYILEASEKSGALKPGQAIIEATSGNTGISLTYYAKKKGYRVLIVMPSDMTEERKRIIRDFGGELIEVEPGDFAQAARVRDELAKHHGYFNPDQFSNPLNVECHYRTTAQEILDQLKGQTVDAFVAGVGTGGTLMGVGKRLKEAFPKIRIIAVEPSESAIMSGGTHQPHGISGIGDGFIPPIASDGKGGRAALIDDVICISSKDALKAARMLQEVHGYCVGVSSGANFLAARSLLPKLSTVVTILSDGYFKYTSRGLTASDRCPYRNDHSAILTSGQNKKS